MPRLVPPPPNRLCPEQFVLAAIVLGATLLATLSMHLTGVSRVSAGAFWMGIASTVAVAWVVGAWVLRERDPKRARLRAALAPVFAGGLVGAVVVFWTQRATGEGLYFDDFQYIGDASPVAGAIIGLVPGMLAAFVLTVLLPSVHMARVFVSHDLYERLIVPSLGGVGLVATLAVFVVGRLELAVLAILVACAFAILGASLDRDLRRAAWLRKVFAPSAEPWRVVPQDGTVRDEGLLPIVAGSHDAVLFYGADGVTDPAAGGGPYRRTAQGHAVALVHAQLDPMLRHVGKRLRFTSVAMLLMAASTWVKLATTLLNAHR